MAPLLALFLLFAFSYATEVRIPKAELILGKRAPDIELTLENGQKTTLSELTSGGPIILSFIYTRCTSACPMIVNGIKDALNSITDRSAVVLLIDFDLRDTPENLREFRKRHGLGESWNLAIPDQEGLNRLTESLDFRFAYDSKTDMFAHPNVLVVLSEDLTVSGYMLGVRYDPERLSKIISLARSGRVDINPIKGLLLKCFRYDPVTGTYTIDWSFVAMIIGGILPILGMAYFLFLRDLIAGLRRSAGGAV